MKIRSQRGMSFFGFILLLALVIFVAYLAMRIVPIYLEFYTVKSAMKGVQAEYQGESLSAQQVRERIMNRLYVSQTANNVERNDIKLVRGQGYQLTIAYEVRKPIMGNLDVIASFDESVTLSR